MVQKDVEVLHAILAMVPPDQRKRKSTLEKLFLKLAIKLPYVSSRRKLKFRRSLVKAQTGDLVSSLKKLQAARRDRAKTAVDDKGIVSGIRQQSELVAPGAGAFRFDDVAGTSASLECVSVVLPKLEVAEPAPRGFLFCGWHPEMTEAASRAAWLEENREAMVSQLAERFGDYDTLSLDVFDTYLLRGPEAEAERFLAFSRFVIDQLSGSSFAQVVEGISPESLTLMRARGMEMTYRFRPRVDGCAEGSINEVAQNVAASLGGDGALAARLLELEIAFEATMLVRNPVLSELVTRFRDRGGRVILVSDMYLHGSQIQDLCRKVDPGSFASVDRVFSSADTIISKRSGKIFDMIRDELALDPKRIVHIGDSSHSDVEMARLAGWNALHLPISRPETAARQRSLQKVIGHFDGLGIDVRRWAKV